jgi:hypothetical protein
MPQNPDLANLLSSIPRNLIPNSSPLVERSARGSHHQSQAALHELIQPFTGLFHPKAPAKPKWTPGRIAQKTAWYARNHPRMHPIHRAMYRNAILRNGGNVT